MQKPSLFLKEIGGKKQEFIQRKECWINFDVSEQALLSMCTCGLSIAE